MPYKMVNANGTMHGKWKKKILQPNWRLHNFYKIVTKEGELVRYCPNNLQREYNSKAHTRNIILKGRQFGFTTNACIVGLDKALWKQNQMIVIIAHKEDAMEAIFSKVRIAWENFQKEYGKHLGFKADTTRSNMLKFNNGSTIKVALETRGQTVHFLHISEFGKICRFYPHKAEEIITGAFNSVPINGRIDIESTAEGSVGDFHDMFWQYWNKKPESPLDFKSFFYSWPRFKEYEYDKPVQLTEELKEYQALHALTTSQINWYALMKRTQKKKMQQEYPTTPGEAFASTGNKVFDSIILQQKIQNETEVPREVGNWRFYGVPNPVHEYVIGADPSEGIGRDSCCAHIIDISNRDQGRIRPRVVGVYESSVTSPDVFAYDLARAGEQYGNALIGVEKNGNGLATLTVLKNLYSNLYTEQRKTSFTDKDTKRLGFNTTKQSKKMIIHNLGTSVYEDDIIIPDEMTLQEMLAFDEDHLGNTMLDTKTTRHLDRVMSMAIAWEMVAHVGVRYESLASDGYGSDTSIQSFDPYAIAEF